MNLSGVVSKKKNPHKHHKISFNNDAITIWNVLKKVFWFDVMTSRSFAPCFDAEHYLKHIKSRVIRKFALKFLKHSTQA